MRFAIKTSPQDTTWADMLAVWQAADELDVFESAWTFDHFYPIFSDPTGPCLEGWVTLTALAQATRRLRCALRTMSSWKAATAAKLRPRSRTSATRHSRSSPSGSGRAMASAALTAASPEWRATDAATPPGELRLNRAAARQRAVQ